MSRLTHFLLAVRSPSRARTPLNFLLPLPTREHLSSLAFREPNSSELTVSPELCEIPTKPSPTFRRMARLILCHST